MTRIRPYWIGSVFALVCLGLSTGHSIGQTKTTPDPDPPIIEPASGEGETAIAQFKYPEGLKCELYAAEPDVANIVAIHRDHQGDMYVCETFRQANGVEDNRRHKHWLDEDLAAQTVQDRIDYIRKNIPGADESYTAKDDRIRLLKDSNGDGKPDSVTVFSNKYNKLEMGTGAGVLSYRGNVYYTCIPDLFELQDKDNDGVAEIRKSLHTGYGVRFAFRGHDMHGLIVGPDGRLYFSIGDRGYNISPTIKDPASGAVFRCELDGSSLEVVATGLRNPQELAFDDFGNLFTGDNNSDSGDKARWTEVVEGGDSGWRMYYQYLADRGPFNREKIWHPFNEDTPAYIIPPIENFSDGPAGLEYYPGTGFGDEFKGRFFLVDFRGVASSSGVRSFRNQPDGAHWKLVDDEQTIWNLLATDLDFGSDGRLYVSDWVFGWNGENKGRLYAFSDPTQRQTAIVNQVKTLLQIGFDKQTTESLKALIGHQDQRIRQESQFELVKRKDLLTLKSIARDAQEERLSRVHAIWGLGQLGRGAAKNRADFDSSFIGDLLGDADWQIVCAAAEIAGEVGYRDTSKLATLLGHSNLRVRFRAAMALGKIGTDDDVPNVVQMLVDNADKDPIVRHGGIMALNGIFSRDQVPESSVVLKLAEDDSRCVRLAVCIAMRKVLESNAEGIYKHLGLAAKLIGKMLGDSDRQIGLEAARTIHDVNVETEMSTLADLIDTLDQAPDSDALIRRVINANVRIGAQANAESLASFAANSDFDEDRRVDAVNVLSHWATPSARDAVLHDWRPLDPGKRNVLDAKNAIATRFRVLTSGPEAITSAAITAAGNLGLTAIGSELEEVVLSTSAAESPRVAALNRLEKLKHKELESVLESLEEKFDALPPALAGDVIRLIAADDEARGMDLIERTLNGSRQATQQSAIETLGKMKSETSAGMIRSFLNRMMADDFAPALRLDVALAAKNRKEASLKQLVKKYNRSITNPDDPASSYRDTMLGGTEASGSKIFYGKTEVSCVRCHEIDGTGGEVGPELSGIGINRDRKYLLESIVHPNKAVAEGYGQVKVLTEDGDLFVGIVKKETDHLMVLMDADGKEVVIEQDSIEGIKPWKSSMPDDLVKQLSKREVRDLVEFLVNRKTVPKTQPDVKHE